MLCTCKDDPLVSERIIEYRSQFVEYFLLIKHTWAD